MAVRGTLHFRARRGGSTLMVGVDKSDPRLAIPACPGRPGLPTVLPTVGVYPDGRGGHNQARWTAAVGACAPSRPELGLQTASLTFPPFKGNAFKQRPGTTRASLQHAGVLLERP